MNEIITINTDNHAAMVKMLGMTDDAKLKKKTSVLNRLRLWHYPIMGQAEVNGKMTNVEVLDGGNFRLEILDAGESTFIYSKTISMRPFMQRFSLQRFVANKSAKPNEPKGTMQKTIMADSLDLDLKDNTGRFNCGKPSGWIEDFKSLPPEMQQLIREIKRVRAVFGLVTMENPSDANGKPMGEDVTTPFIWEINNNQAFKIVGEQMGVFVRHNRLPLSHAIKFLPSLEHQMENNSSYFTPVCKADMSVNYEIKEKDNELLTTFMDWVKNNNDLICQEWDKHNTKRQEEMPQEEKDTVEEFIDIDMEGEDV